MLKEAATHNVRQIIERTKDVLILKIHVYSVLNKRRCRHNRAFQTKEDERKHQSNLYFGWCIESHCVKAVNEINERKTKFEMWAKSTASIVEIRRETTKSNRKINALYFCIVFQQETCQIFQFLGDNTETT